MVRECADQDAVQSVMRGWRLLEEIRRRVERSDSCRMLWLGCEG
jgi:hypothetical protein